MAKRSKSINPQSKQALRGVLYLKDITSALKVHDNHQGKVSGSNGMDA